MREKVTGVRTFTVMRITKVYTKTGDAGKTRLAGGQVVWKDAIRVEVYGTVDELNSIIGLARVFNQESPDSVAKNRMEGLLMNIQHQLLDMGSILATAPGTVFPNMPTITMKDVEGLESAIDECQEALGPLKEFILPGGGKVSGFLHHARTVCRRAERLCVTLSREEEVDSCVVIFLNRLSDALFVFARWMAKMQGESEFLWDRQRSTS